MKDTIKLKPFHFRKGCVAAKGRVSDKAPKEAPVSISVTVDKPPAWLRKMEHRRGLFSNAPVTLVLFLDHTGNWTDIHSMEHFVIT